MTLKLRWIINHFHNPVSSGLNYQPNFSSLMAFTDVQCIHSFICYHLILSTVVFQLWEEIRQKNVGVNQWSPRRGQEHTHHFLTIYSFSSFFPPFTLDFVVSNIVEGLKNMFQRTAILALQHSSDVGLYYHLWNLHNHGDVCVMLLNATLFHHSLTITIDLNQSQSSWEEERGMRKEMSEPPSVPLTLRQ